MGERRSYARGDAHPYAWLSSHPCVRIQHRFFQATESKEERGRRDGPSGPAHGLGTQPTLWQSEGGWASVCAKGLSGHGRRRTTGRSKDASASSLPEVLCVTHPLARICVRVCSFFCLFSYFQRLRRACPRCPATGPLARVYVCVCFLFRFCLRGRGGRAASLFFLECVEIDSDQYEHTVPVIQK